MHYQKFLREKNWYKEILKKLHTLGVCKPKDAIQCRIRIHQQHPTMLASWHVMGWTPFLRAKLTKMGRVEPELQTRCKEGQITDLKVQLQKWCKKTKENNKNIYVPEHLCTAPSK